VRLYGHVRALLRSERGFTLVESLVSMTILMTVMGGMTALMVSGTNAEVDMNRRFQAQTEARLGLDRLRRDVHCSWNVSPAGASATKTLTVNASCPTSGGGTSITWCTVANGTGRYGLWRYLSATCSGGTGRKVADYLTTANAFSYTAPIAGSKELKQLGVTLNVNLTPGKPERVYSLQDDLVLRNSVRA
jgi:type II secretory pathway pseudopilin PulG